MDLPDISSLDLKEKRVLLRADLDVDPSADDSLRLDVLKPTVDQIFEKGATCVILLGHMGRPKGEDKSMSLSLVRPEVERILGKEVFFIDSWDFSFITERIKESSNQKLFLLENLRFHPGEEANDDTFSKYLSLLGDAYINEAFADSHRKHASIVGIPKFLTHAYGSRFLAEIEHLSKIFINPERPVVSVISGLKEDKLNYIERFSGFSDKILIGGRLPLYVEEKFSGIKDIGGGEKVIVADLTADKEDITIHSIEKFENEINKAKTVLLSGPLGKFEDQGHRLGTQRIFASIINSKTFKVAGGGDTEKAISLLGMVQGFNWISVGGGAMLEYLADKTLAGIEALKT